LIACEPWAAARDVNERQRGSKPKRSSAAARLPVRSSGRSGLPVTTVAAPPKKPADSANVTATPARDARGHAVGEPGHRRLLVHHDGHARQRAGQRDGQGDEAAGGEHDARSQAPEQAPRLEHAGRRVTKTSGRFCHASTRRSLPVRIA